jgi:hypothetical protein
MADEDVETTPGYKVSQKVDINGMCARPVRPSRARGVRHNF